MIDQEELITWLKELPKDVKGVGIDCGGLTLHALVEEDDGLVPTRFIEIGGIPEHEDSDDDACVACGALYSALDGGSPTRCPKCVDKPGTPTRCPKCVDKPGTLLTWKKTSRGRPVTPTEWVKLEMSRALTNAGTSTFNEIFEEAVAVVKKAGGYLPGEEMARLRAYEKLQGLVNRGLVIKEGTAYTSTPALESEVAVEDRIIAKGEL